MIGKYNLNWNWLKTSKYKLPLSNSNENSIEFNSFSSINNEQLFENVSLRLIKINIESLIHEFISGIDYEFTL